MVRESHPMAVAYEIDVYWGRRAATGSTRPSGGCAWTLWLAVLSVGLAVVERAPAANVPRDQWAGKPVVVKVRLNLMAKADLAAKEVKYSTFPQGRRCAFTYVGVGLPRNIAYLHKLGFRTTIYASPGTSAEKVQALEAAGAEIAVRQPSLLGGNTTVQEAFDMAASGRRVLKGKCKGPVMCTWPIIGGQHSDASTFSFALNRAVRGVGTSRRGYGAAFLDSNYLFLYDPYVNYVLYLRRGRHDVGTLIVKQDNTLRGGRTAPNERLYYFLLANQFRVAVKDVAEGKIVRFKIRDFKQADLEEMGRIIGKFGADPLIWHATEGEIGAYEYLKRKSRILAVKSVGGSEVEISLALERDVFPPFLLAPLSLKLPKGFPVKAARVGPTACKITRRKKSVHVDIPLQRAFRDGVAMTLEPAAPDMGVPEKMQATLTIRNTSEEPVENARLRWVGCPGIKGVGGLTVTGGEQPFTLPAKSQRKIAVAIRTERGARFGLIPVQGVLTAKVRGAERVFMEGFEIVVAPRLRVYQDPYWQIPMQKGHTQVFVVHLSNERISPRPVLGKGMPTFLSHRAGPCRGVVRMDLPEGMEARPKERPFQLVANAETTLVFTITNNRWGAEQVQVRPVVRFEGESTASEVAYPGTDVVRDEKRIAYKPVDDKGLLFYVSWDKSNTADKSSGSPGYWSGDIPVYVPAIGVKGMCNTYPAWAVYSPFRNIDPKKGTILFWIRKHPKLKNENGYVPDRANTWKFGPSLGGRGEALFGVDHAPQLIPSSRSFVGLRRYRAWKGKSGYVEALFRCMGGTIYHVQANFDWTSRWHHVAMLWDTKARRLDIYIDGKPASGPLHRNGKEVPAGDKAEWHTAPWDNAVDHYCQMGLLGGHNTWYGTDKDEFYIYNRPLTKKEIVENMKASLGPGASKK